jgi:hypothetical protein
MGERAVGLLGMLTVLDDEGYSDCCRSVCDMLGYLNLRLLMGASRMARWHHQAAVLVHASFDAAMYHSRRC